MNKKIALVFALIFSLVFNIEVSASSMYVSDDIDGNFIAKKESVVSSLETNSSLTGNFMIDADIQSLAGESEEKIKGGNIGDAVCEETGVKKTLKMIGAFIFLAKLAVPLLVVGFGIMDLAKAVLGGDSKSVSSNVKKLLFRIIIGAFILFMPTIINAILNGILPPDYDACNNCLFNITECQTD